MKDTGRVEKTRRSRAAAVALGAAVLATAPAALAQSGGHLRVGVERAFGFTYNALTTASESTVAGVTTTREETLTWTSFTLLGTGFSSVRPGSTSLLSASTAPRFAVDYELSSHLTVGAAAFFSWNSITDDDGDGISSVGVGLAPRVGYSITLSDRVSFWPRAGVTLSYVSASPVRGSASAFTTTSSTSYLPMWFNLEPTLVFAADPHVLLTFGLVCDIPLLGDVTTQSSTTIAGMTVERSTESTFKQLVVAAQFGLTGRF